MKNTRFKVRIVYGFLEDLEVVILGKLLNKNKLKAGMEVHLILDNGTPEGNWAIKKVLQMDFINDTTEKDFIGLVVTCKNKESFELLKALRVYDEVLEISPAPSS
jgi:hypothetical protein